MESPTNVALWRAWQDPALSLQVRGYIWVGIWFVVFCFDQLYIKHAIDTVKMRINWGRVFYTNLWASALLLGMTAGLEPQVLSSILWNTASVSALLLSCSVGVSMSYFSFACRAQVSATSFTVIGNVCKIFTVLINICIWDKHASPLGIAFLLVCLAAAGTYQQAPMRDKKEGSGRQGHGDILDRAPLVKNGAEPAQESSQ